MDIDQNVLNEENLKKLEELNNPKVMKVVEEYVKTNLDSVLRFHRKPKGGMERGAEVVKILPQGRSEDRADVSVPDSRHRHGPV